MAVITVTQNGTTASVSTSTQAFSFDANAMSAGKKENLTVTSNVPVEIGAIDYSETAGQQDWLQVNPSDASHTDATASSNKAFTIEVLSDNNSDNERVAKFNIFWTDENDKKQSKEIRVVQMSQNVIFSLGAQSIQSGAIGGENYFNLTSNVDLSIAATDDATSGTPEWFCLDKTEFKTPGVQGKTESFKVTIDKNPLLKPRSGKIIFRRGSSELGTITVTQNGTTASVSTSTQTFGFDAYAMSTGKKENLTVTSNVPIEIGAIDYSDTAGQQDWLKVSPYSVSHTDATVSSDKAFTVEVLSDNNSDNERVAKFNIFWTDENDKKQSKEIRVVQMSQDVIFSLGSQSIQSSAIGGENYFNLTSNVDLSIAATDDATSGTPSWFRLDKTDFKTPGVQGKTESFKVAIDKNPSLKPRNGKIIFRRGTTEMGTITVTQNGTTATVTTSADAFNFAANAKSTGEGKTMTVTSNVPVQINAIDYSETAGQSDWLKVDPTSAAHSDATSTSDKAFKITTLSDNTNDNERVAMFNITWTDENDKQQTKQIRVVQFGKTGTVTVEPEKILANATGAESNFTITANVDLTLATVDDATNGTPEWFKLDKTTFASSGTAAVKQLFKVIVSKNAALKPRSGKINVLRGNTIMASVTIAQNGNTASVTSDSEVSFETNAKSTGKSESLKVTSNVPIRISDIDYSKSSDQSGWLTITPSTFTHDDATAPSEKVFILKVSSDNLNDDKRIAVFNIIWTDEKDDQQKKPIIVTQNGRNTSFSVQPGSLEIDNESSDNKVIVTSSVNWVIKEVDWIKANPSHGGPGDSIKTVTRSITLTADENKALGRRDTTLIIYKDSIGGSELGKIKIAQRGNAELSIKENKDVGKELKGDTITITVCSQDVSFYIDSNLNDLSNGWKWVVKSDSKWLTVNDDAQEGTGKKTITMKAEENDVNKGNYAPDRSAKVTVKWKDGWEKETAETITIVQKHRSALPKLSIANYPKIMDYLHWTVDEPVLLSVDENCFGIDGVDAIDNWNVIWKVGNETVSEAKELEYKELNSPQKYEVEVTVKHKDLESINQPLKFDIYPAPKAPSAFYYKGKNGKDSNNSDIVIATLDSKFVENHQQDFSKVNLQYVFGSESEETIINQRYYQYKNGVPSKAWVRTQWYVDRKPIQSVDSTPLNLRKPENASRLSLTRGHLIAHVDEETPAYISVMSFSGAVVRRINYDPRTDYDEQIDLDGLPAGLYILRCDVGDMRTEEKIVIK